MKAPAIDVVSKLKKVLGSWTLLGSCLPIAATFLVHIGLLLEIPSFIPALTDQTDWLAKSSDRSVAIQIAVGIATISVVFFSFVQFGYSIRHVPPLYVSDYILAHRYSRGLISLLLSSIVVAGFFSVSGHVFNISDIVMVSLLFACVLAITIYFFWLVRVTRLKDMIRSILRGIDVVYLLDWEEKIVEKGNAQDEYLRSRSSTFPVTCPR